MVAETAGVIRRLSLTSGEEVERLDTGGEIEYGPAPTFGHHGFKGYMPECYVHLYSPPGLVVFARPKYRISVWDWGARKEINTFGGFSRRQNVAAFSPDGAFLASGGADGTITIFPLVGNSLVKYLKGHRSVIYSVAYSADGTRLASADIEGVIKVWDVKTGEALQQFDAHRWVWDVAFSPDGTRVASADEGGLIKVWPVNEKREQMSFRAGYPLTFKASYSLATAVAFGPRGDTLATADVNGECDLWSAQTGKHIRSFRREPKQAYDTVAFSRDGSLVVAASGTGMTRTDRYPEVSLAPSFVEDDKGKRHIVLQNMFEARTAPGYPDKDDEPEPDTNAKDSSGEREGRDDIIFFWETATGKLTRSVSRRGSETLANVDVTSINLSDNGPATVLPTGPPKAGDKDNLPRFVLDRVVISKASSEIGEQYDFEAMREVLPTAPALYRNVSPDGRFVVNTVTGELLRRAISSDELSLWLRDVDAGDVVMIVDACYAASAVEGKDFKPAPMGSRGLGQLAFDKGMKILAATQAANAAIEFGGSIAHGLLTFALVREGLELNKADFRAADKVINLKEWLEYGEYRVPGLYDDLSTGKLKGVGKARADLFGVGEREPRHSAQQPSLFNFTRSEPGIVLAQLP